MLERAAMSEEGPGHHVKEEHSLGGSPPGSMAAKIEHRT